jgi:phospholipid/cholesterol/gamma-HCH transport system substrate-binding protein
MMPHSANIRFEFHEGAPGVILNTPVKKSGIVVGRVTKVELIPEGGAMVWAHLDEDKPVRQNEIASIHTSLLGGDAVIDIVTDPSRKDALRTPCAKDATVRGETIDDPIQVMTKLQKGLSQGIDSVSKTSVDVGNAVRRVDDLIRANEEKIDRIVKRTDEVTASLQHAVRITDEVLSEPGTKTKILETIDRAPRLLQEMEETNKRANNTFKNLEELTGVLGKKGDDVFVELHESALNFRKVLTQMVQLTEKLNDSKGSLGLLINDPELYQRINNAAGNIEDLTRELKPVIRDAHILTDELARHPEKLGVRGALERSPGTKWP